MVAQYALLDDFFCAWTAWVIDPPYLYDDATTVIQAETLRRAQCGEKFKYETKPPSTVRGHLNSLARMYTSAAPGVSFVPSSLSQFPQLQKLMTAALTRERSRKVLDKVGHPGAEVLQDEELSAVLASVDWSKPYESQRGNILILGYSTGYRSEVLRRYKLTLLWKLKLQPVVQC
jgi:hypothetical protein